MISALIKRQSFSPLLGSKLLILFCAVLATMLGIRLSHASNELEIFAGAFLVVSGAQIALWVFGIRLEMFGNTTNETRQIPEGSSASSTYERLTDESAPSNASIEERLHLLEGRMLSMFGYVLGETSLDSGNPFLVRDRDKLLKAVSLCERGYKVLKGVGGASEFMALNNLVFYSCALGEGVWREFLLEQARRLLKVGQEHRAVNLILTSCYAILKISDDQGEKDRALHTLHAIQYSDHATDREKREASIYKSVFSPERLAKNAPNKGPQADG